MSKRIIVADDTEYKNELIVASLQDFCKEEGIEASVDAVPDGAELVKRVREGNYDLVFTDNDMPGMDGLSAIKRIREAYPELPVYMVSGRESVKERALDYGANGFLLSDGSDEFMYGLRQALQCLKD